MICPNNYQNYQNAGIFIFAQKLQIPKFYTITAR